jgi:nucleoporin NDC1
MRNPLPTQASTNYVTVLWSWFPFGRAGIRTGLLFIPAFMIFILRVAQLHVGLRTSSSAWHTFKQYSFKYQVIQTIIWYSISAFIFAEIYLWSASEDADLSRIKVIPRTDRTTLNEKPIYVTSFLCFLAFVQAGFHLFYDYDRIDMPIMKTKTKGSLDQTPVVVPPAAQIRAKLPPMVKESMQRVVIAAATFPFVYQMNFLIYPGSIRRFGWSLTRSWAKMFYNLPKSSSLPSIGPYHWRIVLTTISSGFLLVMLWELGNVSFSAYVAQEPLKNDRPITYESRDPNGSLLTGLKGKKLQTRVSQHPGCLMEYTNINEGFCFLGTRIYC